MFDLMELLKKGRLRTDIKLTNAQKAQPPKGYMWIIIGGVFYHVTGTSDGFNVRPEGIGVPPATEDVMLYSSSIISADATGNYPLFNNVAESYQIAPLPMIIKDDFWLTYLGSATAWLRLFLIEVKV